MKILCQFVILVLALTGCSSGFDLPALRSAVARSELVELSKFTPFAWDRAHVFGPYALPDVIKEEVGKDVSFPHWSSGAHCLLVFLADGAVVESLEILRKDADFSHLHQSGGYSPKDAIFAVKQSTDGWKNLEKANKSADTNEDQPTR